MSLQPKLKIHFDDWLAAERAATQGRSEYWTARSSPWPGALRPIT